MIHLETYLRYVNEKLPDPKNTYILVISFMRHLLQTIGDMVDDVNKRSRAGSIPVATHSDPHPYNEESLNYLVRSPSPRSPSSIAMMNRTPTYGPMSPLPHMQQGMTSPYENISTPPRNRGWLSESPFHGISDADTIDSEDSMTQTDSDSESEEDSVANEWDEEDWNQDLVSSSRDGDGSQQCRSFDNECMICKENLRGKLSMFLPCCHAIHTDCFNDLKQQSKKRDCPICRKRVEEVRSLSQHVASPLLRADHKTRLEIMKDVLGEPQSPATYIGRCRKRTQPIANLEGVKRKLFKSSDASSPIAGPSNALPPSTHVQNVNIANANLGEVAMGESQMIQSLLEIYHEAKTDIFQGYVPRKVELEFQQSGLDRIIGVYDDDEETGVPKTGCKALVKIALKARRNLGQNATQLLHLMKKIYLQGRQSAGLTLAMNQRYKDYLIDLQRRILQSYNSDKEESSDEEQ